MSKKAKVLTSLGLLFVVVLIGFLYFSSRNAANQKLITIYKSTTPHIEKKAVSSETSVHTHSPNVITDSNPKASSPKNDFHEHATYTPHQNNDVSIDEMEIGTPFFREIEIPPDKTVVDEDLDSLAQLHEKIETLSSQIQTEYPELLKLQEMTLEEMEALSDEEKMKIHELSLQFQTKFLAEIRNIFSQMPPDHLENNLSFMRETYNKQWGPEFTNKIMAEIRRLIK